MVVAVYEISEWQLIFTISTEIEVKLYFSVLNTTGLNLSVTTA